MDRRGFLQGILAAGMAPAVVKAESLMKIIVPKKEIIIPSFARGVATVKGGELTKILLHGGYMSEAEIRANINKTFSKMFADLGYKGDGINTMPSVVIVPRRFKGAVA